MDKSSIGIGYEEYDGVRMVMMGGMRDMRVKSSIDSALRELFYSVHGISKGGGAESKERSPGRPGTPGKVEKKRPKSPETPGSVKKRRRRSRSPSISPDLKKLKLFSSDLDKILKEVTALKF